MFQWNEEKLRFMEDAAAWGDFHARLAAALAPYLPGDGHICDAGCGTGHLSLALSPYVRQVTAVDVSGEALGLLAENCRKRHMTNIVIHRGDIAQLLPEEPYDAMVFCFFGHIKEILAIWPSCAAMPPTVFPPRSLPSAAAAISVAGKNWKSWAFPFRQRKWSCPWASPSVHWRMPGGFSSCTASRTIPRPSQTPFCKHG